MQRVLYLFFYTMLAVASVIDVRSRRCPNPLAGGLAVCAIAIAYLDGGLEVCLHRFVEAAFVCALLVAFEILWRRHRGSIGIGMGDIKVLFALMMVVGPLEGVLSFGLGLFGLALIGFMAGSRALPALPFIAVAFCIVHYLI